MNLLSSGLLPWRPGDPLAMLQIVDVLPDGGQSSEIIFDPTTEQITKAMTHYGVSPDHLLQFVKQKHGEVQSIFVDMDTYRKTNNVEDHN